MKKKHILRCNVVVKLLGQNNVKQRTGKLF